MANVIINCDDLGLSLVTNEAIGTLFSKNLITSCSALVNFDEIYSARDIANEYGFSEKIGLHFNITQGLPLSDDIRHVTRVFSNGMLRDDFRSQKIKVLGLEPVFMNFLSRSDLSAIKREFNCQVDRFVDIFGVLPSHADSHHGSHHDPIIFVFFCKWARERGIKAVRPQFNMGATSSSVKLVKNLLNRYAKWALGSQADFFGSLDEFTNHRFNKESKIELMVHAIPTDLDGINDIDGINLEQKILAAKLHCHQLCSYRDF